MMECSSNRETTAKRFSPILISIIWIRLIGVTLMFVGRTQELTRLSDEFAAPRASLLVSAAVRKRA